MTTKQSRLKWATSGKAVEMTDAKEVVDIFQVMSKPDLDKEGDCVYCRTRTMCPWVKFLVSLAHAQHATLRSVDGQQQVEVEEEDDIAKYDFEGRWRAEINASALSSILCDNYFKDIFTTACSKAIQLTNGAFNTPNVPCEHLLTADQRARLQQSKKNMSNGHIGEPIARAKFESVSKHRAVPELMEMCFTRKSMMNHNIAASPDMIMYCGAMGEIKCPTSAKKVIRSYIRNYMHQIQCQMTILTYKPELDYKSVKLLSTDDEMALMAQPNKSSYFFVFDMVTEKWMCQKVRLNKTWMQEVEEGLLMYRSLLNSAKWSVAYPHPISHRCRDLIERKNVVEMEDE
jgi:predicted secreted protein